MFGLRRKHKHPAPPPARRARVRPEFASLYPRVRVGRWLKVDRLLRRARLEPARMRAAGPHFEFRDGTPPRNPACRFLRQRCDDKPPPAFPLMAL